MASSSFASGFTTGFGSAFLQFALERFASLGSLTWREISIIWGVEDELRKLQRTFFKIQDLVDHVNINPLRLYGGSNAWLLCFEDMRKLAYDAEALLDHVSLHLSDYCAQHSVTFNREMQIRPMVMSSFSELNLPRKISEMQNKLDDLAKEVEHLVMMEKLKFDLRITAGTSSEFSALYSNTSPFGVGRTIGRETEKDRIFGFLSEQCDNSNFSVFCVMGMSGIGKTAVASDVYSHNRVEFDLRIWASVSMDSNAIRITKSMIEYATLAPCNLSDLSSLQHKLQNILSGKKFLLVLDDYCSANYDEWDALSGPFIFGSQGSKVIITTRSKKVSSIVCSSDEYELDILLDADCWKLIKGSAMLSDDSTESLESIGEEIAKKCKGIPAIATTLGNMLRRRSTKEEWYSILKNELWDMLEGSNIFLRLMQSYLHLPAHLQKCFAYCSIFPQDHEFVMEDLILLWVGEGFIGPKGSQTSEDLARGYFNDLRSRFFFKQCENTNASNQVIYKMHDLIHGMARLISRDICFHLKHDVSSCYPLFGNSCHLSLLHDSNQPLELKASMKNERLRTFLLMSFNAAATIELDLHLFSHLKFLRVLGLSGVGITVLVDSIDKLEYLRYLNLSDNPISHLPRSMCRLLVLQILRLRSCPNLRGLPEEMCHLISLRHLDLDERTLTRMPPRFGKLTNLQHLSVYVISRKSGCGIVELKSLNCLGGSLCIRNINFVSASEASDTKLDLKTCLDKLELEWTLRDQKQSDHLQVLQNLRPPTNLKDLVIRNYCGTNYPTWLSGSSYQFTSIHLQGLKYCDRLPCLGELPSLTFFAISDMPCLELVYNEFYGTTNRVKFPSLESFELKGMSKLTHWLCLLPGAMPCLRTYTLHDCPRLTRLPRNLQSLLPISNVSDCPSLQP